MFLGAALSEKLDELNWMEFCFIVCQIFGARNCMFRYLTASLLILKSLLIFLNARRFISLFTKVYYNLLIKTTRENANRDGNRRLKKGEDTSSNT